MTTHGQNTCGDQFFTKVIAERIVMHDFETSVKLHYDELTEAEQEMTRYILNNRELV
ncbi:MAG: hypothetical protein ACTID1_04965 [Pseudolactococcus laudensis]